VLDALARLQPNGVLTLADVIDGPYCGRFDGGLRVIVATDLSLRRFPIRGNPQRAERFVVLDSAAFIEKSDGQRGHPLPLTPWILIDDPACVPQLVRRRWKEVSVAQ
jgi:hypothetical protein